MTGLTEGHPPPTAAWRQGDPVQQLETNVEVSGATPQGIRWWLFGGRAGAPDRNGSNSLLGAQNRLRRRQLIAKTLGPPEARWHCPYCGSQQHGRPSWGGGSISTSDLLTSEPGWEWLALAVGPLELEIGIDLMATELGPSAGRTMARFLTPGELRLTEHMGLARVWARKESLSKARGTGLLGQPQASVPGGPLDTLADDVGISDLDLGAPLSMHLLASLAWIPAGQERESLPKCGGDNHTTG